MSTKDKILDASMSLFSRKGYLGATTREIAKEAGIAEVTLFRHFSSKENLFKEVINRCSFLPRLRELIPEARKMPCERALCMIGERYLQTLETKKELIRIIYSEVHTYPAKIHKMHEALMTELSMTLAAYIEEFQKNGVMGKFDARFAAMAFLGMIYSYFISNEFRGAAKPSETDTRKAIEQYVKLFTEGTLARARRET